MVFVPILSHTPAAGIGVSKKLWTPQQFDSSTRAYPKPVPAAIASYPTDPATGRLFYVDGVLEATEFSICTGDVFFDMAGIVPPPSYGSHLAAEQALWARGKFSISAYASWDSWSGTQGGGGQDSYSHRYDPPAAPGVRVIINNQVYTVEGVERGLWQYQATTYGPEWPPYQESTTEVVSGQVILAGAPNLSSILAIGKIVYFTNEVAP